MRALALMLLLAGCSASASHPACTPENHAKEKLAYEKEVHLQCATYDALDECPFYPKLKADFDRKIDAGCGQ